MKTTTKQLSWSRSRYSSGPKVLRRLFHRKKQMDIQALEIACQHYKTTYGDAALERMRKQKAKAHSQNYRLRARVARLEGALWLACRIIHLATNINEGRSVEVDAPR
jgi:hypothetical protein